MSNTNVSDLDSLLNQVKEVNDQKIKDENKGFAVDPRILTLKKGAKYTFRFIPDLKKPTNNFLAYKEVVFPSQMDNTTVYGGRSPSDAGIAVKDDLYNKTQWAAYNKAKEEGNEPARKLACKLIPQRKQLANVYLHAVEKDAEAEKKIGQNLVIRYSAQLDKEKKPSSDLLKKIDSALYGEKSKKIGSRALDLTEKGKSFTIVVGTKDLGGGQKIPEYSESEFEDAESLGLSKERIAELLAGVHDLSEFVPEVKTKEQIQQILDEHWFCKTAAPEDSLTEEETPDVDSDDIDVSPGLVDESSDVDDLLKDI
jgi:hypothetical protein